MLKKYLLIQTISRVNRKLKGKDYGFIIDYTGIQDSMREVINNLRSEASCILSVDDVEQATDVFRENFEIL